MPYSHSKAHDERFLADLQRNYRGTARVSLDLLTQFGPYVRDADHKVIGSLERSIRDDDKRHLVQTYIPVKLTEEKFEEALEQLGIRRYDLLEQSRQPRLLELPAYSLICLHGRQRLEAARLCLNGKERWWPVKLYVEDGNDEWQRRLAEEDTPTYAYSDGEIFWNIRMNAKNAMQMDQGGSAASSAEWRWWEKLSKRKQDFLRSFLKHPLRKSFDKLLFIPGIWRGLNIGVLDKVMALRCDEEVSHYIGHIRKTWKLILKKSKSSAQLIDPESVRMVELRAPGASEHDRRDIHLLMLNGSLFPNIKDTNSRKCIQRQIDKIYWLIPTVHTLFEDIKYLRGCQQAIRGLLPLAEGRTVRESAKRAHEASHKDTFWLSYLRVWLFAMGNFASLTGIHPRKDHHSDCITTRVSSFTWHQFAELARASGFENESIINYLHKNPDIQAAEELLGTTIPLVPAEEKAAFNEFAAKIAKVIQAAHISPEHTSPPAMFSSRTGESTHRRCGRVYNQTYNAFQKHFNLAEMDRFLKANQSQTQGYDVTSFFVRQSVFFAFFGEFQLPAETPPTSVANSPLSYSEMSDTLDHGHDTPMLSPTTNHIPDSYNMTTHTVVEVASCNFNAPNPTTATTTNHQPINYNSNFTDSTTATTHYVPNLSNLNATSQILDQYVATTGHLPQSDQTIATTDKDNETLAQNNKGITEIQSDRVVRSTHSPSNAPYTRSRSPARSRRSRSPAPHTRSRSPARSRRSRSPARPRRSSAHLPNEISSTITGTQLRSGNDDLEMEDPSSEMVKTVPESNLLTMGDENIEHRHSWIDENLSNPPPENIQDSSSSRNLDPKSLEEQHAEHAHTTRSSEEEEHLFDDDDGDEFGDTNPPFFNDLQYAEYSETRTANPYVQPTMPIHEQDNQHIKSKVTHALEGQVHKPSGLHPTEIPASQIFIGPGDMDSRMVELQIEIRQRQSSEIEGPKRRRTGYTEALVSERRENNRFLRKNEWIWIKRLQESKKLFNRADAIREVRDSISNGLLLVNSKNRHINPNDFFDAIVNTDDQLLRIIPVESPYKSQESPYEAVDSTFPAGEVNEEFDTYLE